jgi:hypothetical protein
MVTRLLIIAVLLMIPGASPAGQTPSLSEEEIDQRLAFIEQRLNAGKSGAQRWQYGWTGLFAANAAIQGYMAIKSNNGDNQVSYTVDALKSAGALAILLLRPLPAVDGAEPLEARPPETLEQKNTRLQAAQNLLQANAERARERTSWSRHLLAIGFHLVGSTAILALGDVQDAVKSNITGIAVSQAHIWSQPWRAIDDLKAYEEQFPTSPAAVPRSWELSPIPGGLGITIHF